ncbi:hypothetical protein [uncultured Microscilla sp.]|uniref:hypothetical protein n=1 Tax=uncultured Microscilla sp. TaxID=432653 RepID=UPI00263100F4|nr:hypothetical protein [uncultured Microscilla sp.]
MFKLNQQFSLFLLLDILVTLLPASYFLSFMVSKQYFLLPDPYHAVNYVFSYLGFLMFLFNIVLISTGVFFTLKHHPPHKDQVFKRAFIEGSKVYLIVVWIVCLVLLNLFFTLKAQVF